MSEHIVIRRPEFFAGTSEQPTIGLFTQTHSGRRPSPWGRVDAGDTAWMKWTGGPLVARATVVGFAALKDCSPARLRQFTRNYELFDLDHYWDSLKESFYGMVVYVEEERWLDSPVAFELPGNRESWRVLSKREFNKASQGELPPSDNDPGRRSIGARLRFDVLRRDSYTCQYCGRRAPHVSLHIDHVLPVADGGSNELDNLVAACQDCNLGKGRRRP